MFRSLCSLLIFSCFIDGSIELVKAGETESAAPPQRALLVGCTQYPECKTIRPLHGPKNDIPLFSRMLKSKFGFQDAEITTLLAWPEDESLRPTRANIVKAFEKLIEEVQPDSQVVILISGHGTQVPVPEGDNATTDRSEDDGLDEVFLPADVQAWDGDQLPNAVLDNEFEKWLNALADKGAHVWITFDTCHSGTMTRAIETEEPIEHSRMVRSQALAIPLDRMSKRPALDAPSEQSLSSVDTQPRTSGGTITAFSAAQSFEEAPELPRPADAPRKASNYYGLFTYSLVKAIERQQAALSYRDLSQSILNIYCAERGTRGPTPVFEGDLARQVVGMSDWGKNTEYAVKFEEGEFQIAGGELNGLTVGSILAVAPAKIGSNPKQQLLGYLKIVSATPTDAIGEVCTQDGSPDSNSLTLTEDSRCHMVSQDLGEMRVKLAILTDPDLPADQSEELNTMLEGLPEGTRNLFQLQSELETADWILHLVPPQMARRTYGEVVTESTLVLTPQGARSAADETPPAENASSTQQRLQVLHPFPPGMTENQLSTLGDQLANELRKIFTWQNVWRVTDSATAVGSDGELELMLKVRRDGEELLNPPVLYAGEKVEVQLSNQGSRDWWVSLMFLGSDVSISRWTSGSIKASSQFRTLRATVTGTTRGLEGFVVFASPISVSRLEPDFQFLEQLGLSETEGSRSVKGTPNSPFGTLLEGAQTGKSTRSMKMETPDQPSVVLRSWTTRPKTNSGSN